MVIYTKQGNNAFTKYGSTEIIKDNLNPSFKTTFTMFYLFEVHQNIKFEVIDVDSEGSFDLIGICETSLGTIVGSPNFTF